MKSTDTRVVQSVMLTWSCTRSLCAHGRCSDDHHSGFRKPGFFLKQAQPCGFLGFGVLLGFLDKQDKIGKIIQKTIACYISICINNLE